MFGKGSKLYSMLTGKCPKCHEDQMYVDKNPYHLTQTMQMHDHCRNCGFKYKIEPNFFFGAMYVSYGLAIMEGVAVFLISHFLFNAGLIASFIAIFIFLILSMPLVTRFSRNIYINIFVNYDSNAGDIAKYKN
jgi:uncharacterized protein (DUF983 family)